MSANMLGEALRTVCGPLGDLNQKLSGPNGEEWLAALKRFLRKENPWDGAVAFPAWKTITLGTHKNVKDLRKALDQSGYRLSGWASDILGKRVFQLAKEETEVNLVKVSVKDLGFVKATTYQEICYKARELGLHLCPAEVGPALRLQYPDQPAGEWLTVAMEPITGSGGGPGLFRVDHGEDGRWLDTDWGGPGGVWRPGCQFVFVSK